MSSIENKILLIEDDIDIQDNLKTFLEMENFEVAAAANGKQAIELMQKEGKPSLILLDLMMPIMNGYEMLAEMKKRDLFQKNPVPIILLSAATDIEETARDQVVKFVRKPIALDKLLTTIKEIHAQYTPHGTA
ncbi:MAG: response regulator [Pseudobdellovibrio sp.]|nr:response regulator [Pseudobdellovibrio sp.]